MDLYFKFDEFSKFFIFFLGPPYWIVLVINFIPAGCVAGIILTLWSVFVMRAEQPARDKSRSQLLQTVLEGAEPGLWCHRLRPERASPCWQCWGGVEPVLWCHRLRPERASPCRQCWGGVEPGPWCHRLLPERASLLAEISFSCGSSLSRQHHEKHSTVLKLLHLTPLCVISVRIIRVEG